MAFIISKKIKSDLWMGVMLGRVGRVGLSALFICLFSVSSSAGIIQKTIDGTEKMLSQHVIHPFYLGGGLGYGNTDWSEITTSPGLENLATQGAPISATGDGFAWGAFMGYQFSEHFTVEAIYTKYRDSNVEFEAEANNYNLSSLKSATDSYSIVGKILVPFGFTQVYVYADAGLTLVHRKDISFVPLDGQQADFKKLNKAHLGPSFGFGLAYNITPRLFSEASFQYTTGYGKAEANPAQDYIPFVYSIMMNLGVRLGSSKVEPESVAIQETPIKNSVYLGIDAGYGNSYINSQDKNDALAFGVKYTKNGGFTVGARTGVLINPYVATQVEYFYLPSVRLSQISGTQSDTLSSNLVAAEVKAIWPAAKNFEIFGKAGYSWIIVSDQASLDNYKATTPRHTFEPVLGLGFEYRFLKRLAVGAQYTAIIDVNNQYPTTNLGTAGLNYYF